MPRSRENPTRDGLHVSQAPPAPIHLRIGVRHEPAQVPGDPTRVFPYPQTARPAVDQPTANAGVVAIELGEQGQLLIDDRAIVRVTDGVKYNSKVSLILYGSGFGLAAVGLRFCGGFASIQAWSAAIRAGGIRAA